MKNLRALFAALLLMLPVSAHADSVGVVEMDALNNCLSENESSPWQCAKIPYFACLGTQQRVAANPELAQERCLHQEFFAWEDKAKKLCQELTQIAENPEKFKTDICEGKTTPWYLNLPKVPNKQYDRGSSNPALDRKAASVRAEAIQYFLYLKEYQYWWLEKENQ